MVRRSRVDGFNISTKGRGLLTVSLSLTSIWHYIHTRPLGRGRRRLKGEGEKGYEHIGNIYYAGIN
uniref:Uncharacterized protein n=1 Tax=Utricularia reniformis TaxID=192314 RepID=A0A1Y0B3C5_9LAMI|nr:hypothetical protein AEK19_MT1714 [Utricularia reniformis]ART31894.1 hypothetical protein AEK19_MT1714 [Utricularia reniformis]